MKTSQDLISTKEAKKLLGKTSAKLTNEQIRELVTLLEFMAEAILNDRSKIKRGSLFKK